MTIHWLGLVIGLVLGTGLGAFADWKIGNRLRKRAALQALTQEYASLAGNDVNYRIKEDGTQEPIGTTVEITWDPKDGLLLASNFQDTGKPEWHSYIKMSSDYPGMGLGHYTNVNSIHGGLQQVIYSKQTRSFHVIGINHVRKEFALRWTPKEEARRQSA
jgi:hypothetical protein